MHKVYTLKEHIQKEGANENEVKYFYADGNNQLVKGTNYSPGTLYKTTSYDEDNKSVTEYKDKQGQVVMKRNSGDVDTYYVYNDLGQLCYVIPPKAVDELIDLNEDNPIMKQYCYIYKYDERGNCKYKKLPGCEPIYMAYDRANRLVESQDGNQRLQNKWTVTKYDLFGRVISTGTITDAATTWPVLNSNNYQHKNNLIVETYANGVYSNTYFSDALPLTVNYYDDYNYLPTSSPLLYQEKQGYSIRYSPPSGGWGATGLLTGTRTYLLDGSGAYTASAMYYDDKGRVVQTRAKNHLGGFDITYNVLDFTGKPLKTYKTHGIQGLWDSTKEIYTYAYDNAQRLLTTTHQLNGGSTITLATNVYDELGRVKTKTVGGTLDATNYSYNIRNWLTSISGSRFYEDLYYNTDPASLGSTLCYNGNISCIKWSIPADNLGADRAYKFYYDGLNRLLASQYYEWVSGIGTVNGTIYDENMAYDKHGNIKSLVRFGLTGITNGHRNSSQIDFLGFTYNGNQLISKEYNHGSGDGCFYGDEEYFDRQNDYGLSGNFRAYDTNGNVTSDINDNVWGIQYNLLNLPDKIQFYQGHQDIYTYSASGVKLKVTYKTAPDGVVMPITSLNTVAGNPAVASVNTTDYVSNYIYQDGSLKMILLPEGYWQSGHYHYYLKDHLGSNRVVLRDDNTLLERNHYYPSGMRFGESAVTGGSVQPYRHTGHEMQAMHGLNWIDNGARMRSVNIPQFTTVDPLCEKKPWLTPYHYCSNNPMNRIDPDGRWDIPKWYQDYQKITNAASSANSYLTGIATAKVSVSVSAYSVGGSVNVAGTKVGAKVEVASATGTVSTQSASVGVSLFKVEGNASLPNNTSAKVGLSVGNATATMDTKSNVTTEVKATNASAKIENGGNQINTNFESIGVGTKLGPVVTNVELNVVKLTNYVVGMANFVGTVISTKLSEYLPNISQEQILKQK